jgi:hypothetical protein
LAKNGSNSGTKNLKDLKDCHRPEGYGGPDVIRKEEWSFYRTISGVRLYWELEEPKGLKGPDLRTLGKTSTSVWFDI